MGIHGSNWPAPCFVNRLIRTGNNLDLQQIFKVSGLWQQGQSYGTETLTQRT